MAKVSVATVTNNESRSTYTEKLNSNFAAIAAAIEKTYSRDGTSPNSLEANMDVNGKRIQNLPPPISPDEPARSGDLTQYVEDAQAAQEAAEAAAQEAEETVSTMGSFVSAAQGYANEALGHAEAAEDFSEEAEGFADEAESWAIIASPNKLVVKTETSNYTLGILDAGAYIRMSSVSLIKVTVPLNSSEAFDVGTVISLSQANTGQLTVEGDVGVTVNSPATLKLRGAHSAATLVKVGTDEWDLNGDLEAA